MSTKLPNAELEVSVPDKLRGGKLTVVMFDDDAPKSRARKVHLLKRFGQRVTVCATVTSNIRPPLVTNDPNAVTCKACKHLFTKGKT